MSGIETKGRLDDLLAAQTVPAPGWSEPISYNLGEQADRERLEARFALGAIRRVVNPIGIIADNLAKLYNPGSTEDNVEHTESVDAIMSQGINGNNYGTWYEYPDSGIVAHFPTKKDLRALKTSRLKNLVTAEEQARQYDLSVAVIGASVGASVVRSFVKAGIGDTVILADGDIIEPPNLGRLDAEFLEVGSKKIDHLARYISRTDPYVKQVHLRNGLTEANLSVLLENGTRVVVDAMDDLRMKVMLRLFAREHGIALIMPTDMGDKSVIDVERYDQGLQEIFNGRLSQADIDEIVRSKPGEPLNLRLTAKITGLTNTTPRLIQSAMQRGKTLNGIPQLGTTASVGGAYATVVTREIAAGRPMPSGRYTASPKEIFKLTPPIKLPGAVKILAQFIVGGIRDKKAAKKQQASTQLSS